MERRPVGFGLIGTGMAGGFSARELAFVEGGFLAAVCSRDPEGCARSPPSTGTRAPTPTTGS